MGKLNRVDLEKKFGNIYYWLLRHDRDLLNEYFPITRNFWCLKTCSVAAKKFTSRIEWRQKSSASYHHALKHGWVDTLCTHMEKQKGIWNDFKKVRTEALKYGNKKEWKIQSPSSYKSAKRNNWFEKVSKHMQRPKSCFGKKVINLTTGKIFDSVTAAGFSIKVTKGGNIHSGVETGGKRGGYHWAYCDENGKVIND